MELGRAGEAVGGGAGGSIRRAIDEWSAQEIREDWPETTSGAPGAPW